MRKEQKDLSLLNQNLYDNGATEECRIMILTFFCQYYLNLCDNSGNPILPTSTQCEEIMESCPMELEEAAQFNFAISNCHLLPSEKPSCFSLEDNDTLYDELIISK